MREREKGREIEGGERNRQGGSGRVIIKDVLKFSGCSCFTYKYNSYT